MRIISNFRDYYDSAQATGQDQTLVYKRFVKEQKCESSKFPAYSLELYSYGYGNSLELYSYDYGNLGGDISTIGFCGKIYCVIRLEVSAVDGLLDKVNKAKPKYCYTLDDVNKFVEANWKEEYVDEYYGKNTADEWSKKKRLWTRTQTVNNFKHRFEEWEKMRDQHADYFVKHECPIFTVERTDACDREARRWNKERISIKFNAPLKGFEFFRVFEAYAAYQELMMYLGSQAEPRKPIPPISDETMAEIKGFDKWSFRKPPGKKKRSKGKQ